MRRLWIDATLFPLVPVLFLIALGTPWLIRGLWPARLRGLFVISLQGSSRTPTSKARERKRAG
jgi:hypothetical protein